MPLPILLLRRSSLLVLDFHLSLISTRLHEGWSHGGSCWLQMMATSRHPKTFGRYNISVDHSYHTQVAIDEPSSVSLDHLRASSSPTVSSARFSTDTHVFQEIPPGPL